MTMPEENIDGRSPALTGVNCVSQTPASALTFAFVDIETTALAPQSGGRVCEVAVLLHRAGRRIDTWSQLVYPGGPMPAQATMIHGISDEMVRGQPEFPHIAPKLISLLSGAVVVCHNADFDVPFLAWEFARAGLRFPPATVLDTLKYARKQAKFRSNRLGNIALELGFSSEGWHRALSDVMMTERVFLHFLEKFSTAGEPTLADLVQYQTVKTK